MNLECFHAAWLLPPQPGMQHPIDAITETIIGAAIRVHQKYGPGLLESVYSLALGLELVALGYEVEVGKPLPLEHQGVTIKRAYVVDLLVNNCVVVELKAVKALTDTDKAQLLTYLRLMNIHVGLLINFNVTRLVDGVRRVVNNHVDEDGNRLPPTKEIEPGANSAKAPEKEPK